MTFRALFVAVALATLAASSFAQDCFIYLNYYYVDEEPPMTCDRCWGEGPIPDGPTEVKVYEYPSGQFLGVNTTFNGQAELGAAGYFISYQPIVWFSGRRVYAVVRYGNIEYESRLFTMGLDVNVETVQSDWACMFIETWAFFRFVYPGDSLCSEHFPLTSNGCWTGTPIPDGTPLNIFVNGLLCDSFEMNSGDICSDTIQGGFFAQQEPFSASAGCTVYLQVVYDSCRYWTNSFTLNIGYQAFPLTEADWNCECRPCCLSGPLNGTLGPGSYRVTGAISVVATDSLTLLPGTIFTFDGPYPFNIYGTLLAEGTETDSIVFTTDTSANPDRWRGLRFNGSNSSGCRLAYCLIENGFATGSLPDGNGGGGVYCDRSSPAFMNCTISGNSASAGGAVYCGDSSPTFMNCIFSDNYAYNGGGVGCYAESSPIFANCTFIRNIADGFDFGLGYGGGVDCEGEHCSPNFTNCIISQNAAIGWGWLSSTGGGVACGYYSSPTFVNCAITGNTATVCGGGILCDYYASPSFTSCCITHNSAYSGSGGVCCSEGSSPTFTSCTISSNSADRDGCGVYCGGGFFEIPPAPIFNSTIIAFSVGEGMRFESIAEESQIVYCNFFGNSGGPLGGEIPTGLGQLVTTNANGDSCDAYFNIFLDPMFVDTSADDYHLLAGSPCVDAGDPTLPYDPDSTIADIGAFYYHQSGVDLPAIPLPSAHALHPNFPNPFNPVTTIRYDVPTTGRVSLTIFNLLGQRVATLLDGNQFAGSHTIVWDASNLPSGLYLCRMKAAGFEQTRKMLLVR